MGRGLWVVGVILVSSKWLCKHESEHLLFNIIINVNGCSRKLSKIWHWWLFCYHYSRVQTNWLVVQLFCHKINYWWEFLFYRNSPINKCMFINPAFLIDELSQFVSIYQSHVEVQIHWLPHASDLEFGVWKCNVTIQTCDLSVLKFMEYNSVNQTTKVHSFLPVWMKVLPKNCIFARIWSCHAVIFTIEFPIKNCG